MSDPIIDPYFDPGYLYMQYKYPRLDQQPVVRIPISGPKPFNTLVVVRGVFFMSVVKIVHYPGEEPEYQIHPDLLYFQGDLVTNFKLIGFDQRVAPPFEHSTTAALQMFQKLQKLRFLQAVDEIVDGFFNEEGKWVVKIRCASIDEALGGARAYLSSWVLCYEPPANPDAPRGLSRYQNYGLPWTEEASREEQRRLKRIFQQSRIREP